MPTSPVTPLWWQLTPSQRALLLRLRCEGPLQKPERWEMATVRALLARGLLRPRNRARDGVGGAGTWFLTAQGAHLAVRHSGDRSRAASERPAGA